jgi:shikimate dehydrogenase
VWYDSLGLVDFRFEEWPLASLDDLDDVLRRYGDELGGFCVTNPYKKEILSRLSLIDPEARAVGAVNCVKIEDGRMVGHNTDLYGFAVGLEKLTGTARPRALILGTGGAACAVRWVLGRQGIEYRMVSRTPADDVVTYDQLTPATIDAHRLIINTTPLGTHPDVDGKPSIPYDAIGAGHYLYDLVYNPSPTAFLKEGARRGATTIDGTTMLHAQAQKNLEIWNLP